MSAPSIVVIEAPAHPVETHNVSGAVETVKEKKELAGSVKITVLGDLKSNHFHQAKVQLNELYSQQKLIVSLHFIAFTPFEWAQVKRQYRTEEGVVVFVEIFKFKRFRYQEDLVELYPEHQVNRNPPTGNCIGGNKELLSFINDHFDYHDSRPSLLFNAIATTEFQQWLQRTQTVTFKLTAGSRSLGNLTIELFGKLAPKTVKHFIEHFKSALAVRIVKGGWIQAGIATSTPTIPDENFIVKHDRRGIVGFCNTGVPHTASNQFFITLKPIEAFNKRFVAFGRVVDGNETLLALEALEISWNGAIVDDEVLFTQQ